MKKGNGKAGVVRLAVGEAPTKAAVQRLVDFLSEIQTEMQEMYYHKSESEEELITRRRKQPWREIPK